MSTFREYTVRVTSEPSYYGQECSQDDASRIAASLSQMIRDQFPGIAVEEMVLSGKTTGPDESVIDDINRWIEDNWTAAL